MKATNEFINAIEDDVHMKRKYDTFMTKVKDKLFAELDEDADTFKDIDFGSIDFYSVVDYIVENYGDV